MVKEMLVAPCSTLYDKKVFEAQKPQQIVFEA